MAKSNILSTIKLDLMKLSFEMLSFLDQIFWNLHLRELVFRMLPLKGSTSKKYLSIGQSSIMFHFVAVKWMMLHLKTQFL